MTDTGIGIKEEDRSKVFKMFGKLEATASINTTGVGLGLSICKKIIEALDGCIYLADEEGGQGTKFVFVLTLTERALQKDESYVTIEAADVDIESERSCNTTMRALLGRNLDIMKENTKYNQNDLFLVTRKNQEDLEEQKGGEGNSQCPCINRSNILVVDDNVFNLMTLQFILSDHLKLNSDKALNGLEAINLLK